MGQLLLAWWRISFVTGYLDSNLTDMFRHEGEATLPLLDVEKPFTKPSISIVVCTAPESLADVIVQVNDDTLV